ncbi:pre-toxin TG domain-containing protein [Streptomyces violascens]|uniref:Pre-toxin TG domain-containing protein n=1 Tax=Streptomyces violascens TaxID=67381 RepID=A0ABQ3QRJ9_9ACTN|nr:pre-toxin TG domain-containing protein [Streptomyces violascens]GGU48488.1 hypothetical protein GCM10010289_81280 [Streptomyces violascens]GHI39896.1 hypothetical protein Sviol_43040 [Streptomyces violascens]
MKHRWKLRIVALMTALAVVLTGGVSAATAASASASRPRTTCDDTPLAQRITCIAKFGEVSIYGIPAIIIVAHAVRQEVRDGRTQTWADADIEKHINQYVNYLIASSKLEASGKVPPQVQAEIDRLRNEANKELRQILLGTGKVIENAATLARGLDAATHLIDAMSDFITSPGLHQGMADMNAGFEAMKSSLDTMNSGVKEINEGLDQMNRGVNKANSGMDRINQGIDQSNKAMANLNKAVPQIGAAALKLRELPVLKDFDFSEALKDFNNGRSPLEDKVVQTKFGAILDLLPAIGDGKGIVQAITGQDMATGDRLGVTERLMGSVILLRWMKAGKSVIKVEELNKAIKAEKATGKIDGWLAREAYDKVPSKLKGFETVNNKGVGYRWNDGKGNGIRIDEGNLNNSQKYQQVDHVVINSGGKILGRDGKPIEGSIKENPESHIPLTDWLKWKEWNKP